MASPRHLSTASVLCGVLAALSLSACGSTVGVGAQNADGLGSLTAGDGLSLGSGPNDGVAGPDQGAGASSIGAQTDTGGSSAPGADSSSDGTVATEGGGPSSITPNGNRAGKGFTANQVNIGWGASDGNEQQALSALGVAGLQDVGDTKAQIAAVVKDLEAHKRFGGRRINMIPHVYSTTEIINDPNTAAQKACSDMIEDHKVIAMLGPGVTNDTAKSCFSKGNLPIITAGGLENPPSFRKDYSRYPLYLGAASMFGDRFFHSAVDRLHARNFFEKWNTDTGKPGGVQKVKIGALVLDYSGAADATLAAYNKALAQYGLKVDMVTRLPENTSNAIAVGSSAVLRFRQAGVTHVLGITLPFMTTAQQQGYHPRYFVNVAYQVVAQSAPEQQLGGAMTIGYVPAWETDEQHYPGDPTSASVHCLQVMKAGGQTPTNLQMRFAMQVVCDELYSLADAVDGASGEMTGSAIVRGYESLGSSFVPASAWSSTFGPNEHASARTVRDMKFDASCRCFYYADKVNHPTTG